MPSAIHDDVASPMMTTGTTSSVPGRNRRGSGRNSLKTSRDLHCDACEDVIFPSADHVELSPCGHRICTRCAIREHMERGIRPFCCPVRSCHGEYSYTSRCKYFTARVPEEVMENAVEADDDFEESNLPVEFLMEKHGKEIRNDKGNQGIVLFCAKMSCQGRRGSPSISTLASSFILRKGKYESYDEDAIKQIHRFFAFLNPVITKASKPKIEDLPVMSPRILLEYRMAAISPLFAAVFSLGTGEHLPNTEKILAKDNPTFQNQALAAIVASDVLLRSCMSRPTEFQLMFGEVVSRQKTSRQFQDLCSAFQLIPSRNFCVKARSKEVVERMERGLTIQPRDCVFLLADNIGFRVMGDQAGYDSWTVVIPVVVKEETLKSLGFYVNDGNPESQISRKPEHSWEALTSDRTSEELIDFVVGVRPSDHSRLSECVFEDILIAIEYAHVLQSGEDSVGVKLPRLDHVIDPGSRLRCDELMNANESHLIQVECIQPVAFPRNNAPVGIEDEIGGDVFAEEANMNRFATNNAALEPWHQNLAQNDTIERLMRYVSECCGRQVREWDEYESVRHLPTAERPVAEIFAALGTDGQPAALAQKMIAADAREGHKKFPRHLLISFGGFHTVMKLLYSNGELFEQLLRLFVGLFRKTTKKEEWFLFPSDPRQREAEHPFMCLAHNLVAAVKLSLHRGEPVSAREVNQFMVDRAKEYPICMLALMELRMASVARMLKAAARAGPRGSICIFVSALKYAMRVFAMTHKTDYMRLSCDLLLFLKCASPAQRKLYESLVFTQLSTKGHPMYHDLFVELAVNDLRRVLGKVYGKGLDTKMEHQCSAIPTRSSEKLEAKSLRDNECFSESSFSRPYSEVVEDSPFFPLFDRIWDMDLWTQGKAPVIGRNRKGDPILAKKTCLEVPGREGGRMHSSILSAVTECGEKRVQDYFCRNYIEEINRVSRSEKEGGVSLSKVNATTKRIEKELECAIIGATGTSKAVLKKLLTIDSLVGEIEKLRGRGVTIPPTPSRSGSTHQDYVDFLVKWRRAVFKKDPTKKETIINDIKEEHKLKEVTTAEEREQLLGNPFFSLEFLVAGRTRYSKRYDVFKNPC